MVLLALLGAGLIEAQELRLDVNKKGKYGYVDEAGKVLIPYIYTEAAPFENGLAKVRQGKKYGFIDTHGQSVGKMKYSLILPFTGDYCRVASGGVDKGGGLTGEKWGFLNSKGEEVIPPVYDEIGSFERGFAYVKKGKKYGIIDEKLRFLLEPKYVAVGSFDEYGLCWFVGGGKVDSKTGKVVSTKYGVIDRSGKIIIPAKYRMVGYFYNIKGANTISASGAWQINLLSLQRPLSPLFNRANGVAAKPDLFSDEAQVESDSSYLFFGNTASSLGLVERTGKILLPEKSVRSLYMPSDGMVMVGTMVKKETFPAYYRIVTGTLTTYAANQELAPFVNGLGKVSDKSSHKAYFVDEMGKKVTDTYRKAFLFEERRCVVQDDQTGKYGAIDSVGKACVPFVYDDVKVQFCEGLLGVCQDGKWGFVDKAGTLVIPTMYAALTNFNHGWACAKEVDGKWGMIDRENRTRVPFRWEDLKLISEPEPRFVWGENDLKMWCCWDCEKGSLAFHGSFKDAENYVEGMAYVLSGGLYGAIDTEGNYLIPCAFDNRDKVVRATSYMKEKGLKLLTTLHAFRLNLYEDTSVNAYRITDVIPKTKWDY
ncbi:MAG: WG repeat-containing protein [Porphyromonadaceae bacterium]|nr:WG repeat-containing protein [Porphyromonadaceae bacterium]